MAARENDRALVTTLSVAGATLYALSCVLPAARIKGVSLPGWSLGAVSVLSVFAGEINALVLFGAIANVGCVLTFITAIARRVARERRRKSAVVIGIGWVTLGAGAVSVCAMAASGATPHIGAAAWLAGLAAGAWALTILERNGSRASSPAPAASSGGGFEIHTVPIATRLPPRPQMTPRGKR